MAPEDPVTYKASKVSGNDAPYARSYAACDRCRRRKVKCVMEQRPPCEKCKRERRDCLFTRHRRNTGQREPPGWNTGTMRNDQQWNPYNSPTQRAVLASQQQPSTRFQHTSPARTDFPPAATSSFDPNSRERLSLIERALPSAMLSADDIPAAEQRVYEQQGAAEPGFTPSLPWVEPRSDYADIALPVNQLLPCTAEQGDIWAKCRFVRQGWLTAQAAVTYIELFRRHIAPFTPVHAGDYCSPENQRRLVEHEPMLCCTILMISSKFFTIAGEGGVLRAQMLHQRLWEHCEALIRRILYGLEETSVARVRIVSTIESFLLLADWQPQSILFPLDHATVDGDPEPLDPQGIREAERNRGPSVQWRNHFLKPARRSDRMSLMMLGTASNLAYELGLFANDLGMTTNDEQERKRRMRTRKLLYIYVVNIAIKMGFPSGLPQDIVFAASKESFNALSEAGTSFEAWNTFADLWLELVRLSKAAIAIFFGSHSHTRRQLLDGQYVTLIHHFTPLLDKWNADFRSSGTSELQAVRDLLFIEYHTLRSFVHALSMQAVVERAAARSYEMNSQIDLRSTCFVSQDIGFIREVIISSREILNCATGMALSGVIRLIPVRQTLSIISAAILLFKAISLGVSQADLQASLETIEDCIAAFQPTVASDELDFSSRFAALVEARLTTFRNTFIDPRHKSDGTAAVTTLRTIRGDPMEGVPGVVTTPQTPGISDGPERMNSMLDTGVGDVGNLAGDAANWWTRPFDPGFAPFSAWGDHISAHLEIDSLDFLWNASAEL